MTTLTEGIIMRHEFYGEGNTAYETIESEAFAGITRSAYGESVVFGEDVSLDDLQAFARLMAQRAIRAESQVQSFSDSNRAAAVRSNNVAETFGKLLKAEAQRRYNNGGEGPCHEYEAAWRKMRDALTDHGYYSEAHAFAEGCERRQRYTLTVEVLAPNDSSAYDWRYSVTNALNDNNRADYGVDIVEWGDINPVPVITDDNENSDVSLDDLF
jgi:hypothetical protein